MSVDNGSDIELSASAVFAIAWDALADMLGSAATAAVVRRAGGRAIAQCPELAELSVVREELEYRYKLPKSWSRSSGRLPASLRVLSAEIGRLLVELTGTVVVRRLQEIPELRACAFVWRNEEEK